MSEISDLIPILIKKTSERRLPWKQSSPSLLYATVPGTGNLIILSARLAAYGGDIQMTRSKPDGTVLESAQFSADAPEYRGVQALFLEAADVARPSDSDASRDEIALANL